MIFEALSTSKEPNGLETGKIVSFIEVWFIFSLYIIIS